MQPAHQQNPCHQKITNNNDTNNIIKRYTDFAEIAADTNANNVFWRENCKKLPNNAVHVKLTIGDYVDYYKPTSNRHVACSFEAHAPYLELS